MDLSFLSNPIAVFSLSLVAITALFTLKNFSFGKFSFQAKEKESKKELQERLVELEKKLRRDDLESRIQDEFKMLRQRCSERRKRFAMRIVEIYRNIFTEAYNKMSPENDKLYRHMVIDHYASKVLIGVTQYVGPEMIRLVFENSFLDPEDRIAFDSDTMNRSIYLLGLSMSWNRQEWQYSFERSVYEDDFMPLVEPEVLTACNEYFREVVIARNNTIKAMYSEYGDMYHSHYSFKSYIEKRWREIY